MTPPSHSGVSGWAAGVATAVLAALLAPAGAAAQVPGPPEPCITLQAADAAAGDLFACALAMEAEQAAIGSVLDDDRGSGSGAVYVFGRGGNGAWAQRAKVLAGDGAAGDQLGFAVGLSGDRIAAGAPFRNEVGTRSGAVYLFEGGGSAWAQTAKLVPPGLGARDELGRSVAVSGAVVAAGAPGDDDRGSSAGAVYVFELDGGAVHKLTAADGAAADGFGFSLALAGGTLLVGAPFADEGGAQAGAVYVFERQTAGWVQTAKLTAADRRASSVFGWSVALAGDRAAIGARLDDGAAANAGAAYVFGRAGGSWSQQAKLVPPDLAAGDELGASVALAGEAVVAGARFGAVSGLPGAGAAYVFEREGGGWTVRHRLVAATPGAGDELGFAVGVAGDAVFAGAYRDDDAGTDAGTFCVFDEAAGGPGQEADLAVSKSDGVTSVAPSGATVYTITVTNAGPSTAAGARVTDEFPAALGCEWSCAGAAGGICGATSGAGDIDQTVTLPAGGSVTFSVPCSISPNAAGTIANTASVAPPEDVTDPDPSNNSATDVDAVVAPADAGVSKTDGVTTVTCGGPTTYTITAFNAGSRPVTARVTDDFPALLTCAWSCAGSGGAGCGAATGAGDIDQVVTLPVGSAATFTAACTVAASAGAGQTVSNTATVAVTSGGPDFNPSNDSSTDTDTVVCDGVADLSVTKSDGVTEIPAGEAVTYTITATNAGPSPVTGARLVDEFPLGLSCAWSCAATGGAACGDPSGEGPIDQLVDLPVSPSAAATFTAVCAVGAFAPDDLSNTATVSVPAGVTDPVPSNDSATDVDTVLRISDLTVTKTADPTTVAVGDSLVYTVTVANDGPSGSAPVSITDEFPDGLDCTWVCTGTSAGVCGQPEGVGDIVQGASLAPGHAVTYVADCTVTPGASGTLINTAAAANPPEWVDPTPDDNAATATVTIVSTVNLSITKSDFVTQTVAGQAIEYTLEIANAGPDDATGVRIVDLLPANLSGASWSCDGQSGSGDLDVTVDLPAGSTIACAVLGATPPGFCGPLDNTATVVVPPGHDDPDLSDNTATDGNRIFPPPANGPPPLVNLCASKDVVTGPHAPGSTVIYEILLFNGGPGPVLAGEFLDELPQQVTQATAVADSGVVGVLPGNVLIWNGPVPANEVVTITVTGVVDGEVGEVVINQGQFSDLNAGVVAPTDDPRTAPPLDPTVFTIAGVLEIPTLGAAALAALAALLAAAALRRLRRGRARPMGGAP